MKHKITDRMVFTGTCLGYGLFMLYVACSFLPVKALHNRYVNRRVASTLYLPKWDLYTASPQTLVSRLYKVEGSKVVPVDLRPFVPEYVFGLDRKMKVIAQEVSAVSGDKALVSTLQHYPVMMAEDGDVQRVLNADTLVFATVAKPEITMLRGKYLIAMYAPAGWAMSRVDRHEQLPMNIVAVNIVAP